MHICRFETRGYGQQLLVMKNEKVLEDCKMDYTIEIIEIVCSFG